MSDFLDKTKQTVKDHPAETIAAASVITTIGVVFYYRNKQKRLNNAIHHCRCHSCRTPPLTAKQMKKIQKSYR